MLWFLNWLPHSREPEDGLCSLSILLSSDLGHKATTILQRKQAPHLRSPGRWKEAVKAHLGCVVMASALKTPWWLCTQIPSTDSAKGWEFFKFMHILLSSNIKCFFFVIVTSACFDCQHLRSQITKARL